MSPRALRRLSVVFRCIAGFALAVAIWDAVVGEYAAVGWQTANILLALGLAWTCRREAACIEELDDMKRRTLQVVDYSEWIDEERDALCFRVTYGGDLIPNPLYKEDDR